jgi:uncharacterized protein (DUF362 family)
VSKVWIAKTNEGSLADHLRAALAWLDWQRIVPPNSRVWIKPNLTFGQPMPGVTVTPAFLAAVAEVFRELTPHVTFCESDGGYSCFPMEEAFASHGLYDLEKRFGIRVQNLSKIPCRRVSGNVNGKEVSIDLPVPLLDDCDVFITLPVPKIHAMTRVSLAFKNQWGCVPGAMRLRNHPEFTHKIILINRALRTRMALFDGTHFLNKTGPMIGVPVRKDLLIASDDIGAGSKACCHLMGIDDTKVRHLMAAREAGMYPANLSEIEFNESPDRFRGEAFYLKRNLMNYVALAAFHSPTLTRLIYDSATADVLHKILYSIRRNRFAGRLLYGEMGPPKVEGRRST